MLDRTVPLRRAEKFPRCGLRKDRLGQLGVRKETLQPGFPLLEILQSVRLIRPLPTVPQLPSVACLPGYAKLPHHLGRSLSLTQPNVSLAQFPNDLLHRNALPSCHLLSPLASTTRDLLYENGDVCGGQVTDFGKYFVVTVAVSLDHGSLRIELLR
jgi:hypothetical protein